MFLVPCDDNNGDLLALACQQHLSSAGIENIIPNRNNGVYFCLSVGALTLPAIMRIQGEDPVPQGLPLTMAPCMGLMLSCQSSQRLVVDT